MFRIITDQSLFYRILRHVVLFFSMVLVFTIMVQLRVADATPFVQSLLMVGLNGLIFFSLAYITVYWLIPAYLNKEKIWLFPILFLAIGFLLSGLKFLLSDYLFFASISPGHESRVNALTFGNLLVNLKDMSFVVAAFVIAKFARDRYLLDLNIREFEHKRMEAELKLLIHQTDPHVIFNNLNNLYSISINRPDLLGSTMKSLKNVLHYLFRESKKEKVSLLSEVRMIENYIELERLRYGERLKINFSREGEIRDQHITPLIIYPFVENCFVHGAGEEASSGWIDIRIRADKEQLFFYAANSVCRSGNRGEKGSRESGSDNLLRRLEIQYPNNHQLTIRDRQQEHIVELSLHF